ncbi:hypothetical protein NAI47_11340, partial [Francisella tularensis subsp. holarctica]|nr:hypothetical protein [Francisella tularensis subsp. holarctica]
NYSIHSLAIISWAKQNLSVNLCILSVDTGFAAANWNSYLEAVFDCLTKENISYFHLKSEISFQDRVLARKQFPSQKIRWCAS